jgi:hypothetical protein
MFQTRWKEPPEMELRPLGFGEIFDRAVTLYIRNLVPFAAIVAVVIVPLWTSEYIYDRNAQPQLDAMIRILEHPGRVATGHVPTLFDSPGSIAALVGLAALAYVIWPFVLNAVAVGVARLYRNQPVEFRVCYGIVFHRWVQIAAMLILQLLVFFGCYVAAFAIGLVLGLMVALIGAAAGPIAPMWLAGIAALLILIVTVPLLAPLVVALTFAMYGVVIEERGAVASLVLGFSRVFNRAEFWRALLFALAAGAVVVGASLTFGIFGMVAALMHLPGLAAMISSLSRAIIAPFGTVLLAIYYFDVRIRREGLDLEASFERLTGAPVA